MKRTMILLCAGILTAPAAMAGQTPGDRICHDLRAQHPSVVGRIGVTCHAPRKTTYFNCKSLDGSVEAPTDALVVDEGCAHPWG